MKRQLPIFTLSLLTVFLLIISCGTSKKSRTEKPVLQKNECAIFPKAVGYVNDFEGILTDQEVEDLTSIIEAHESQTGDQIAIVTVNTLEPYNNIEDYSLYLANCWGIGQKGKNNGILIALGKGLRKIRIQNGLGIEKRLTDAETKTIIDQVMIPFFVENKYFEGLKKGIEAIIEELE